MGSQARHGRDWTWAPAPFTAQTDLAGDDRVCLPPDARRCVCRRLGGGFIRARFSRWKPCRSDGRGQLHVVLAAGRAGCAGMGSITTSELSTTEAGAAGSKFASDTSGPIAQPHVSKPRQAGTNKCRILVGPPNSPGLHATRRARLLEKENPRTLAFPVRPNQDDFMDRLRANSRQRNHSSLARR